jgi:hypothetical protein
MIYSAAFICSQVHLSMSLMFNQVLSPYLLVADQGSLSMLDYESRISLSLSLLHWDWSWIKGLPLYLIMNQGLSLCLIMNQGASLWAFAD